MGLNKSTAPATLGPSSDEAQRLLLVAQFEGWNIRALPGNEWVVETDAGNPTTLGSARSILAALRQAEEEAIKSDTGNDAENRRRYVDARLSTTTTQQGDGVRDVVLRSDYEAVVEERDGWRKVAENHGVALNEARSRTQRQPEVTVAESRALAAAAEYFRNTGDRSCAPHLTSLFNKLASAPPSSSERRDAELPPHTPDFGAPGHPKHWCERCRLEAEMDATPSIRDEFKAMGEGNATVLRKWKGYLEVFGLTIVPLRAGERRDEVTTEHADGCALLSSGTDFREQCTCGAEDGARDTARLDAIERIGCAEIDFNKSGRGEWWTIRQQGESKDRGKGTTLREAIDDAVSAPTGLHQDSEAK